MRNADGNIYWHAVEHRDSHGDGNSDRFVHTRLT